MTRADLAASERVRAVALLHSDPVVTVAPATARIDKFGQHKGKTLAVIGLIKAAARAEELDRIHARIDESAERFSQDVVAGSLEEQKTAPIALAVDDLGRMIAERRRRIWGETLK